MTITSTDTPLPTSFLLVLYAGHQLLDSAGPLDILSMVTKTTAGANLSLTIAAETLDPVNLAIRSPTFSDRWEWEHIPELPLTETGGFSGSRFNPRLTPDVTFAQALRDLRENHGMIKVNGESRYIDCVIVPGGIGSRTFKIDRITKERRSNVAELVDFLSELNHGDWVRCAWLTVCTGSDILARTGLLNGRRATTNANAFGAVKQRNPGVGWLEKRRWVRSLPKEVNEADGKRIIQREVWTSAGISAGMDLMLWFVAEVWGMDFARMIAKRLEYEWRESIGDGEVDPYYG